MGNSETRGWVQISFNFRALLLRYMSHFPLAFFDPLARSTSYFVQSAKFSDAAPDGWIAAILFRMKHVRITRRKRGELLSTTFRSRLVRLNH